MALGDVGDLVALAILLALPLLLWGELLRRWRVQRALARQLPPCAWWRPVVLETSGREDAFPTFEGAGVLAVHGGSVRLSFRRLGRLGGSWTRDGSTFETLVIDGTLQGTETVGGIACLRVRSGALTLALAVEPGPLVVGSEERAGELRLLLERALRERPDSGTAPSDGDPFQVESPLLSVGSVGPVELWRAGLMLPLTLGVVVAGGYMAWREWLREHDGGWLGVVPPKALCFVLFPAAAYGAHRIVARAPARTGRVDLFEDRLVFTRDRTTAVGWDELAGYRDDSADLVRLVRAGEGEELTIPTRAEADRTAVLALLDRKGLGRLS